MINRPHRQRNGFTLIEVLVATAVTLLMMISLAKIFKTIGDSMQEGRATLELNNRLRDVSLRIQHDLRNATAATKPPLDADEGAGYLKYYDGPLTDYSAALYSASDAVMPDASRYGDTDDILMFTARADDVWFSGKVPLFVLQGVPPYWNSATDHNLNFVTIASQYAEIALFCQPVVEPAGNPTQSPAPLIADPSNYEKVLGSTLANNLPAYMPAKYRLHYRPLLIRPDLNTSAGGLPSGIITRNGNNEPWMLAQGNTQIMVNGTAVSLPSPTCDMTPVHQQCDLSIRHTSFGSPGVSANSLEDLTNPANRFAHIQIPLSTGSGGSIQTATMPILALGLKINLPVTASDAGAIQSPSSALDFQSGFLHPAFTLHSLGRIGEDVLASDILAFDIKGFDPGAPILVTGGGDGQPGIAGVDDNGVGGVDDDGEIGWDGTDDDILSPADPGYGAALAAGATVASTGEYVDLGWGRKTRVHNSFAGITIGGAANTFSELSGLNFDNLANSQLATDALYRSGLAVQQGTAFSIYQPSFDTWTSEYEQDGILQAEPAGTNRRGVIQIFDNVSGPNLLESGTRGSPGSYVIDIGNDGLDNNLANGIDDLTENETSAPFPSELSGLKITIRMEDPATRIVKQMSIGKEFETTQ